jgi:hypothetical protein
MPRRSILSTTDLARLLALPVTRDDLILHFHRAGFVADSPEAEIPLGQAILRTKLALKPSVYVIIDPCCPQMLEKVGRRVLNSKISDSRRRARFAHRLPSEATTILTQGASAVGMPTASDLLCNFVCCGIQGMRWRARSKCRTRSSSGLPANLN